MLVASFSTDAQSPNIPDQSYLPLFDQQVQRAQQEDDELVGLAIGIIDAGQLVYQKTLGETSIRSGDPITEDTVFRIASVSKTFTGILLADLAESGVIDLDTPISTELFDLKGTKQPSLLEVASHQTGLPPNCLLYTSPSPRDLSTSRMPSSA